MSAPRPQGGGLGVVLLMGLAVALIPVALWLAIVVAVIAVTR